jgi:acetyl esterase/lipase
VVFMHGDGGGSVGSKYWDLLTRTGDELAAATRSTFVVLVRPGYRGPTGRSSGEAKGGDDDYTAGNVKLAAEAIGALKARFRASRVIVAGTSGGAATAALVMGRYPGVADAAWLNACPCQIQPWRAWRMQSAGRTTPWSSLSPDQHVVGIAANARFAVVVGDKDINTLSKFSEAYVAALKARGIAVELTLVSGGTHPSTWRSPESAAALAHLR